MSLGSARDIWETALGELQLQVSKPNYETWLKDTLGLSYQNDMFIVGTSSSFAASWLEKRLFSLVRKTLISITGQNLDVEFRVYSPNSGQDNSTGSIVTVDNSFTSRSAPSPKLNAKYTFATFVVGSCNRMAHAAAAGIIDNPGHDYNPLFIHSGPGLGKTHLLQAIGHAAVSKGFRVIYTSSEQFTNEFIGAVRDKDTEHFRNKFRNVDFLLIDDVQFISGKGQTQESFFHTFNALHNENRQIVLASDRPPKSLELLEDRLCSRFEGGLIVDILPPSLEIRVSIIEAKLVQQQMSLGTDIIDLLASNYQSSIRELEGAINRVTAYIKLTGDYPSVDLAKEALRDISDSAPSPPSPEVIMKVVCDYFNLSPQELSSKKKVPHLVQARHLAMYLVREECHLPVKEIGRLFGGRDHSTVLQGCRRISKESDATPHMRQQLHEIRNILYRF